MTAVTCTVDTAESAWLLFLRQLFDVWLSGSRLYQAVALCSASPPDSRPSSFPPSAGLQTQSGGC